MYQPAGYLEVAVRVQPVANRINKEVAAVDVKEQATQAWQDTLAWFAEYV
ncbi:MAG TPA: hypothetical protein PKE64_08360 [Anaerolineae bacterium]|nr:hypothetical protein [Anaerolineae bacterium]HMR64006.1 hypothetical protein [Anaerolineae bacterium]